MNAGWPLLTAQKEPSWPTVSDPVNKSSLKLRFYKIQYVSLDKWWGHKNWLGSLSGDYKFDHQIQWKSIRKLVSDTESWCIYLKKSKLWVIISKMDLGSGLVLDLLIWNSQKMFCHPQKSGKVMLWEGFRYRISCCHMITTWR